MVALVLRELKVEDIPGLELVSDKVSGRVDELILDNILVWVVVEDALEEVADS